MKKVLKFFKKHSYIFVLIVALLFIPQSFSYQAKLNTRVIVTGLAIDKVDDSYEVTAQVVLPVNGSEAGGSGAKLGFISETGSSFAEGLQKISYKIGKTAGLSHVNFLMVGSSMLKENVASALDYIVRDARVSSSILMLICPEGAKEMINKTKDLQLSVAVGLQKIYINKQEALNGSNLTVEEFLNEAYGISKSSLVSAINISNEEEGEQKSPEQASIGQSQSSSGEGEQKGRIDFYNDIYYFKGGEYVGKFSEQKQLLGIYFADQTKSNGEIKVENVNGQILKDATIGMQFRLKKTKRKLEFLKGRPHLVFDIELKDVEITEILNGGQPNVNIYDLYTDEMIEIIKKAIKEHIEECITSAFEQSKKDQVDIFNIGQTAYRYKPKQWKEFYEKEGENYLKKCDIKVNVSIKNVN